MISTVLAPFALLSDRSMAAGTKNAALSNLCDEKTKPPKEVVMAFFEKFQVILKMDDFLLGKCNVRRIIFSTFCLMQS